MEETIGPRTEPRVIELSEQATAVVAGAVAAADVRAFFDEAFQELQRCMACGGFEPSGAALAFYPRAPGGTVDVEAGFPVEGQVLPSGSVVAGGLPGGRAATCVHRGSYEDLAGSWDRLAEWCAARGLSLGEPRWEVYVTEPRPGDDPADMVTELYWVVEP